MTFDIGLKGSAGRQLISRDFSRELHGPYIAAADRFNANVTVEVTALLENPRGVGVTLAQRILQQFGLKLSDQVLLDWETIFTQKR